MSDAPRQSTGSDERNGRWVWSQHWSNVLFLHWRLPSAALRAVLPAALELETWDGDAWVSLVLFRLRVRLRGLPFVPGLSAMWEANWRTYVRLGERPGIWFLRVWANRRAAIRVARWFTPMPYLYADLSCRCGGGRSSFDLRSRENPAERLHVAANFAGIGRPVAEGTRDAWFLERYRLYVGAAGGASGPLQQACVAHPRWTVREVNIESYSHGVRWAWGDDLARPPDAAHYSPGVAAQFGAFERVSPVASFADGMASSRNEGPTTAK